MFMPKSNDLARFDCLHVSEFSAPVPSVDDIVYCRACKGYRTVIANTGTVAIAYCTMGTTGATHPGDPCYKVHSFSSVEAAESWCKSHSHHTTLEMRPFNA